MTVVTRTARLGTRLALRVGITVLLLSAVVYWVDIPEAVTVLGSVRFDFLTLMLLSMLVERFYATYRWFVLLQTGEASGVSYPHLLRVNFASGFLGCFLPTAGMDVLRIIGHARKSDDLAMSVSSVFLDRYLGVLALAVTALVGLAINPMVVTPGVQYSAWLLVALMLAGSVLLTNRQFRSRVERRLSGPKLARAGSKYRKLMSSLDSMRHARSVMLWSLVLAFGHQLVRIASVSFGARALDIEVPLVYLATVVPVIIFIQLLPIAVGGFGAREAAFVYFLGAGGVAPEGAFALSLLVYVMTVASNLPGAWMAYKAFARPSPAGRPEQAPGKLEVSNYSRKNL